ncbi:MAG: secretin N-terminal domain-containing protein [Planctomycetota bacterium]|jgi:type II secretory pathway component GspD/PulD (secretin)
MKRIILLPALTIIFALLAAPAFSGEAVPPAPTPPDPAPDTPESAAEPEMPTIKITPGTKLSIQALFSHLSKLTGKPVLPHSSAASAKSIEFVSDVEATYGVLVAILDVNGYTIEHKIIDGREVIRIFDQRNLRPLRVGETLFAYGDDEIPDRNYLYTQVINVRYANPQEIERALNTRIIDRAGAGSVLAVRGHPILILRDFAPYLKYYAKIIRAMDIPPQDVKLYTVQLLQADASEMANTLTNLIQRKRTATTRSGVAPGGAALLPDPQVVADVRTNKLIIMAVEEKYVELEKIIKELDVELKVIEGTIHVYPLKHQDAQKLGGSRNPVAAGEERPEPPPARLPLERRTFRSESSPNPRQTR